MNVNNLYSSIEQVTGQYLNTGNQNSRVGNSGNGLSFEEVLKQTQRGELKFSKHAGERLQMRNINLTGEQISRLSEGAKLAEEKGIRESLMIMDKMAFIINVPNNTVVTAMDTETAVNNVFTNIDGAVIV